MVSVLPYRSRVVREVECFPSFVETLRRGGMYRKKSDVAPAGSGSWGVGCELDHQCRKYWSIHEFLDFSAPARILATTTATNDSL